MTLLVSCSGPTRPTDIDVGKPFELKEGRSVILESTLLVKFDRVLSDSRCPIDVVCITAGNAVIGVTVSVTGQQEQLELHTDAPQSQASFAGYVIRLNDLQPHPRASRPTPSGEYVATLTVEVS